MATAEPGWYPDITNGNQPRYWNGTSWDPFVPLTDEHEGPIDEDDEFAELSSREKFEASAPETFTPSYHTPYDPSSRGSFDSPRYQASSGPLSQSTGSPLRGDPYLTSAEIFWYVVSLVPTAGGYLQKVVVKKALSEAGLTERTAAERGWYIFLNVLFGVGYFIKVPVKIALRDAELVSTTGFEEFWYILSCIFFGAGYLTKVYIKKALQDAGLVTMTDAEHVWFVLQCVWFGSGYLAKIPTAKALSELDWRAGPNEDHYPQPVARKKWWHWVIAVLLCALSFYRASYVFNDLSNGGLAKASAYIELNTAVTTLVNALPATTAQEESSVRSTSVLGFHNEAALFGNLETSLRAIDFPASTAAYVSSLETETTRIESLLNSASSTIAQGNLVSVSFVTAIKADVTIAQSDINNLDSSLLQ